MENQGEMMWRIWQCDVCRYILQESSLGTEEPANSDIIAWADKLPKHIRLPPFVLIV